MVREHILVGRILGILGILGSISHTAYVVLCAHQDLSTEPELALGY